MGRNKNSGFKFWGQESGTTLFVWILSGGMVRLKNRENR